MPTDIIKKADLPTPVLSIAPGLADRFEGSVDAGVQFTFGVTRGGDSSVAVSARYRVASTQAKESDFLGPDFQLASVYPTGIISFAPGETSKTISVFVVSDRVAEPDEAFSVTLSEPVNAVIGTAIANGIIRNDDLSGNEPPGQDLPATSATPVALVANNTFSATIESASDHDWFRLDTQANQLLLLEVAGKDDNAGSLSDPALTLRDASGTQINFDDDSGTGLSSRIAFRAPAAATYFLDVSGVDSATGSYQIRVLGEAAADPDAAGNTSTTRVLVPNEMQIGRRESPTDADWYRVDLTAGTIYEFAAIGAGLADPLLRLRAADGTLLVTNDDSNGSLDSIIEYRAPASGAYYLDVGAYSSTDTGAYSVWAQQTETFSTDTFSFATGTFSQAEGNSGSRPFSVAINRTGSLAQSATVVVQLEHVTSSNADLELGTAGADGQAPTFAVSFGAGAASSVLNLLIKGDTTLEPDERFNLRLVANTGQSTGAIDTMAVFIANDDQASGASSLQPVYRFAKISNGAYFFTGSKPEQEQIIAGFPDFRPEGVGFYAYADRAVGAPVFRFANLNNGGYFYTGSVAERDATVANYPNMRFEGSTFSVATPITPQAQPVYRLANLTNGAYLYTPSIQERDAAQALGFWRYEGVSFFAPGLPDTSTTPIADDYASDSRTSGRIAAGQTINGAIGVIGDADWFAISLDAGQRYVFDLKANPENSVQLGDPLLALWNGAAQFLVADDNSGGGTAARIQFTPSLSGTYYLDAQGNGGARGAYLLTAASAGSNVAADDFAATSATTGRAEPGRTASGQIEVAGDSDWLSVSLEGGQQYTISVAANGSALRPAVEVIGPAGATIATNPNTAGAASLQLAVTAPTAGQYFVAVKGTPIGAIGAYTVSTSTPSAPGGGATGSVGFIGDEKPLVIEGSEGDPGRIVLSLARTGAVSGSATVTVQLVFDEDATAQDIDLGASGFANGTAVVNFAPGQSSQVLRLVVRGDAVEENGLEGLHLRVISAANAAVGPRAQLRLLIQDDDRLGGGVFTPAGTDLASVAPAQVQNGVSAEFSANAPDTLWY